MNELTAQIVKFYLATGEVWQTATEYGVNIGTTDKLPCWRLIGCHHLTPEQNKGKHNIFIDAVDSDGNLMRGVKSLWEWNGRQPHENTAPVTLDKPAKEFGADIAMFYPQTLSVWMAGLHRHDQASDIVTNLHTRHPDEGRGNTLGHHSFLLVFMWVDKEADEEPEVVPPPVEPKPPTRPDNLVDLEDIAYHVEQAKQRLNDAMVWLNRTKLLIKKFEELHNGQ